MDHEARITIANAIRALTAVLDGRPTPQTHYGTQKERVFAALHREEFRSLGAIAFAAGCSTAAASARIRDLRNIDGWTIERRRPAEGGSYEYRLGDWG